MLDVPNKAALNTKAPVIYKTVTGSSLTITDAIPNLPLKSLTLTIIGDPTDVGTTSASVVVSPSTVAAEGTTYTKSFDAIYEGTLDFISGKLTITKAILDLGSIGYNYNNDYHYFFSQALYGIIDTDEPIYSSDLTVVTPEEIQAGTEGVAFGGATYIYVYNNNYVGMTIDEFKAAVAGKCIAYSLRTPRVVQLSAEDIRALSGTTYISSDDGNLTVEYSVDTKSYIDTGIGNIDLSGYATKADTVLDTTLSRGRAENTTVGEGSFAFGNNVEASGKYSIAEGYRARALGDYSHADGRDTLAQGMYSRSDGRASYAVGTGSRAEGLQTTAYGNYSHTEGYGTQTSGAYSHASGVHNIRDSYISWPEWMPNTLYVVGDRVKITTTVDNETTVIGYICNTDNNDEEFTIANWDEDQKYNYVEIIGNGTGALNSQRSNAYALDWDGNGHYMGDVYVHSNADSSGGTKLAKITDIPFVPVQDVQVAGTSILQNGVANIPVAGMDTPGVVSVNPYWGIGIYNNQLIINGASAEDVQNGNNSTKAISTYRQHQSVFFGLSKIAGADLKNDANVVVGIYPDYAKAAIQSMLGVSQMLAPVNPNMTAEQAYAIGDVFAANGKLYKATAAIAQDGAIIPDTNCVETTMVDESVRDVQVNGTSIVGNDGIANMPTGSGLTTMINPITNIPTLIVQSANTSRIKGGTELFYPVAPARQHESVFYGLSKAAGVDLANETVTLGTYPEASKTAIKAMLGVEEGLKVVRLI